MASSMLWGMFETIAVSAVAGWFLVSILTVFGFLVVRHRAGGRRDLAVASLLSLLLLACSTAGDGNDGDASDVASLGEVQSLCKGLGEEACRASDSCTAIEGWPLPQACLVAQEDPAGGLPQFAGCSDGKELLCSAAFGWAHPVDQPEEIWLFPDLCLPASWVQQDGDPCCVPTCNGKLCGDDGCGGSCGECSSGQVCIEEGDTAGTCCTPTCADSPRGPPCGSDGCGGSCGECYGGTECVETDYDPDKGICFSFEEDCKWVCNSHGAQCGEVWHGLGGGPWCDCGDCPEGEVCEDQGGWSGGICVPGSVCVPNCDGKACGPDGCGGSCGSCGDGLECLATHFGFRCTQQCELFSCPGGQFCLIGLCVDKECEADADCGEAPAHYCDGYLQCRERIACEATDDCITGNKSGYCDEETGYCMFDGHCWDDADCSGGTCGPDHWCQGHNCYDSSGPGCPPHLPICHVPLGEEPACDGMPCASCVAPCIFDADCQAGLVCGEGGECHEPGNDCILDADCGAGQYCHPGCVDLNPACESDSECGEGKPCVAGFCIGDDALPCDSDLACLAWAEGLTCQDGFCLPEAPCVLDSQCPPTKYCQVVCQIRPTLPQCTRDIGCPVGQVCDNEQCKVPPECYYDSQCPAGHVCASQLCQNDQGVCAWLAKGAGFCDDDDPCTVDSCDAVIGCVHVGGDCL